MQMDWFIDSPVPKGGYIVDNSHIKDIHTTYFKIRSYILQQFLTSEIHSKALFTFSTLNTLHVYS